MSTTSANVSLNITIKAKSNWGDDCNMAQIKKQAIRCVENQLRKALQGNSVYGIDVKSIQVTAISHEI